MREEERRSAFLALCTSIEGRECLDIPGEFLGFGLFLSPPIRLLPLARSAFVRKQP
jgi:hypothetical protein